MKIHIDLEVPSWTRWLAAGISIGLVVGLGIGRLQADPAALKSDWKPGNTLKSDDLNRNFQRIQAMLNSHEAALSALTSPDCPLGYSRKLIASDAAPSEHDIVLCTKGADEIVRVGNGGTLFWIDRYEASIWSDAGGGGTQYGISGPDEFPADFPVSGQYRRPLYSVSMLGQLPTTHVTWFQADAACETSGKRLPTREEWFRAARGTYDSGNVNGSDGACLTSGSTVRSTGSGTRCVSRWGAEDMIGNVWEWTAEWYAGPGPTGDFGLSEAWPTSEYNDDLNYNLISHTAYADSVTKDGLPAAAARGGSLTDGKGAGLFALSLMFAPTFSSFHVGFRCVITR